MKKPSGFPLSLTVSVWESKLNAGANVMGSKVSMMEAEGKDLERLVGDCSVLSGGKPRCVKVEGFPLLVFGSGQVALPPGRH